MSETQKSIIAPDNYRELSKPFESTAAAEAAWSAFWEEFYELRNKHKLPDVMAIARIGYLTADGVEGAANISCYAGNPLYAESMTAWAFGAEQVKRQEEIAAMLGKPLCHKGSDRRRGKKI